MSVQHFPKRDVNQLKHDQFISDSFTQLHAQYWNKLMISYLVSKGHQDTTQKTPVPKSNISTAEGVPVAV
jgi:hypothetical protein